MKQSTVIKITGKNNQHFRMWCCGHSALLFTAGVGVSGAQGEGNGGESFWGARQGKFECTSTHMCSQADFDRVFQLIN